MERHIVFQQALILAHYSAFVWYHNIKSIGTVYCYEKLMSLGHQRKVNAIKRNQINIKVMQYE